jgi:predicted house-cleaning NTP pyrophosphatase (Maf/HAM1 superfamily)
MIKSVRYATTNMILASSSPRGRIDDLLKIPFKSTPADIDESLQQDEKPLQMCSAWHVKNAKVYECGGKDKIILAADTIVSTGSAFWANRRMSPRQKKCCWRYAEIHQVATAICVMMKWEDA